MKKLTEKDVEFTLSVFPEDMEIRGNVSASGDDELDKKIEDKIVEDFNNGNVWAWCWVKVTAKWKSFTGYDTLGGCSYKDENSFKQVGGYYEDMKAQALDDLNRNIESTLTELKFLK